MKAIISRHRSKYVDEFQGQSFDYVLTVCYNAKKSCPVFPGHARRLHRAFDDPAVFQGAEVERLALFRRVRNEIEDHPKAFPSSSTRNLEVTLALKGIPDSISPAHQDTFQVHTR